MGNYSKAKEELNVVGIYLKKMDVPYDLIDMIDEEGEKSPAIVTTYQHKDYEFEVTIRHHGDWINVYCFILDTSGLDNDVERVLYKTCLELNYLLPEVTFSAHKDDLYIEADMLVGVPFKDFEAEFNSIALGINQFVALLAPRGLLPDTWGRRRQEMPPSE